MAFVNEGQAVQDRQSFLVAPRNQSVLLGQTASLSCTVLNKKGIVWWMKGGDVLGTDLQPPSNPRYKLMYNNIIGEYSLKIDDVVLEDNGEYQCLIESAEGELPLLGKAVLTVLKMHQCLGSHDDKLDELVLLSRQTSTDLQRMREQQRDGFYLMSTHIQQMSSSIHAMSGGPTAIAASLNNGDSSAETSISSD